MEGRCVLCEVRNESLCECRVPSLHRWLVAVILALPFQPPPPALRASQALSRALFLLPRPPSTLGAVPIISFNQFLRRSDHELHEGLDNMALTSNMTDLGQSSVMFFLGADCSLNSRHSRMVLAVLLLLNNLIFFLSSGTLQSVRRHSAIALTVTINAM
jgi:hypothetical protein